MTKTGFAVDLRFTITQHSRDTKLMSSLISYFFFFNFLRACGLRLHQKEKKRRLREGRDSEKFNPVSS